ncbi:MAG TPA: alpha-galactosidase [Prolixibacteraceae bacterium]|nr:alpha-galactosidase [Prolixibacteraceae bacterium]
MKRLIYVIIIFLGMYGCSQKTIVQSDLVPKKQSSAGTSFRIDALSISGDVQPFKAEIRIDTLDVSLYLINLTLYTDFPSPLPPFKFNIKYPQNQIDALWSSRSWSSNSFINIPNYSRLQSDYSVVSGLTNDSKNKITISAWDLFKSRYTGIDIKKESDSLVFSFNFFNTSVPDAELLEYKVQILMDLRDNTYSKTVRECIQWRLNQEDTTTVTRIDPSLLPVYSLWYPMDRNIPLENITHYFDSISAMGFRSVLFDDGWQNVVRFDVDKEGRWDPSETSVVKEFMDKAREKKMKIALWYSKPFIGAHNYVFKKFDGKYLQYITSSQPILDIRYPEVRKYISSLYGDVVTNWGIDGIWFNYLNGYYPDENIIMTKDLGRDFVSVRKSLDSLRLLMKEDLLKVNPELSINQSYPAVGPLHTSNTKTINGFLGKTVLNDVREKLVNNRLMYGDYSPFMEVMGIHPKDPAVDVALKFQSILFGAPYISYFSYTLPEDIRQTLSFWVKYWKSNSQYLLSDDFDAYDPVHHYTVLRAGNETKQIIDFYARTAPFDLGYFNFETADLINSSDYPYLAITGTPTGKVDYITYDYTGKYTNRGSLKFKKNVAILDVPVGGFVRLIVK